MKRWSQGSVGMIANPEGNYYECDEVDELIDPRWRPMRTAPRDRTRIEVLVYRNGSEWVDFLEENEWADEHTAWRPCHPEWNEDPDAS